MKAGLHSPYLTNEAGVLEVCISADVCLQITVACTNVCITTRWGVSSQNNPESALDIVPKERKKLKSTGIIWARQDSNAGWESSTYTCSFSFVWSMSAVRRHRMGRNATLDRICREVPSPLTEGKRKTKDELSFSVASFRKAFSYC